MRIECDLNEEEFDWWQNTYRKIKCSNYTVNRVYRDQNSRICVELNPVILSEQIENHQWEK